MTQPELTELTDTTITYTTPMETRFLSTDYTQTSRTMSTCLKSGIATQLYPVLNCRIYNLPCCSRETHHGIHRGGKRENAVASSTTHFHACKGMKSSSFHNLPPLVAALATPDNIT